MKAFIWQGSAGLEILEDVHSVGQAENVATGRMSNPGDGIGLEKELRLINREI